MPLIMTSIMLIWNGWKTKDASFLYHLRGKKMNKKTAANVPPSAALATMNHDYRISQNQVYHLSWF
jgi:hypothetical protein